MNAKKIVFDKNLKVKIQHFISILNPRKYNDILNIVTTFFDCYLKLLPFMYSYVMDTIYF